MTLHDIATRLDVLTALEVLDDAALRRELADIAIQIRDCAGPPESPEIRLTRSVAEGRGMTPERANAVLRVIAELAHHRARQAALIEQLKLYCYAGLAGVNWDNIQSFGFQERLAADKPKNAEHRRQLCRLRGTTAWGGYLMMEWCYKNVFNVVVRKDTGEEVPLLYPVRRPPRGQPEKEPVEEESEAT